MKRIFLFTFVFLQMTLSAQIHHRGLFDEFIRETSDPLFHVDSAHFLPSELTYNDTTTYTRKYLVRQKGAGNNMIEAEQYQLNESGQLWEHTHQYSATYHDNGILDEYTKLFYFPDSAGWVVDEYQKNDSGDNVLCYVSYFRYPLPQANGGSRQTFQYNDHDSLISYLVEGWGITTGWRTYYKNEYVYNDSGYRTQDISYDHDSAYTLYPTYKKKYFYEYGKVVRSQTYKYNLTDSVWELKYRYLFSYDEAGNHVQTSYYKKNADSVWYHYYRRTYIFNSSKKVIKQYDTPYDTSMQQWIPEMNLYRTYYDDTLLESWERYYFREDTGIWVNSHKCTFFYDENLNITLIEDERGPWTSWEKYKQNLFSYDQNGSLVSWLFNQIRYGYDTTYWVRSLMEKYFYGIYAGLTENRSFQEYFIQIYPNPASETINIKFLQPNSGTRLRLYSADYKLVFNDFTDEQEVTINFSNYKKGVYFLHSENKSSRQIRKVIVQ